MGNLKHGLDSAQSRGKDLETEVRKLSDENQRLVNVLETRYKPIEAEYVKYKDEAQKQFQSFRQEKETLQAKLNEANGYTRSQILVSFKNWYKLKTRPVQFWVIRNFSDSNGPCT